MVWLVGMVLGGLSVVAILLESLWLTVSQEKNLRFTFLLTILILTILAENLRYRGFDPIPIFVGFFITVLMISAGFELTVMCRSLKK
jgi:hypothetical protein